MQNQSFEELAKKYRFIIYGTGYVCERFLCGLENREISDAVSRFCVSDTEGKTEFRGKPLLSYKELESEQEEIVVVAIHKTYEDQIKKNLDEVGIQNYRWVETRDIYDLLVGVPAKDSRNLAVCTKRIAENIRDYNLAIRYLGICGYYDKENLGTVIYKKVFTHWLSKASANARLEGLYKLIKSWDENGYNPQKKVLITQEYRVIDGMHRTALAIYKGLEKINCDMYTDETGEIEKVMGEGSAMPLSFIKKCKLSDIEYKLVVDTQKIITGGIDA